MRAAPNPYTAPSYFSDDAAPGDVATPAASVDGWKEIARRWERLRPLFNGLLLVAGLPGLGFSVYVNGPLVLAPTLVFAVAANVMYLLGPIGEMYLDWIATAWGWRRPSFLAWLPRNWTVLLFVGGLLFSLPITFLGGFSAAF